MRAVRRELEEAGLTERGENGNSMQELEYRIHPEGFGAPMDVYLNGQRIFAAKVTVEQEDGNFALVTLVLGGVTVHCHDGTGEHDPIETGDQAALSQWEERWNALRTTIAPFRGREPGSGGAFSGDAADRLWQLLDNIEASTPVGQPRATSN